MAKMICLLLCTLFIQDQFLSKDLAQSRLSNQSEIFESPVSDCSLNGIELKGKVKIVDHFPDLKIQYVDHFPDIKVKFVDHFPDDCGEWKIVDNFPDFTVQIVDHFPDLKVKKVDHFPGMD